MESRWHECGHDTTFKTRWMNQIGYQIVAFCMVRDPYFWKYSDACHHSDTIIVGRDPEIAIMRPVMVMKLIANFVGRIDLWDGLRRMIDHAFGRILPDEAAYTEPIFYINTFRTAHRDCVANMGARAVGCFPALLKQRFNLDFYLRRPLPQAGRPYLDGPEVAQ